MNNQKSHWSNTKTRAEVQGSTRKIYKQKGTGKARHGAITAPIFVGGGIALGPKMRKTVLELPKKMKRAALISALAQKAAEGEVLGVTGLDKASGKTKEMAGFFKKISKKSALIVSDQKTGNVLRSVRNIKGIDFLEVGGINAYEIIKHRCLILTQEAVTALEKKLK